MPASTAEKKSETSPSSTTFGVGISRPLAIVALLSA